MRRVHAATPLTEGRVELDPPQAHHLRDVLRLGPGDAVEAFDDAGRVAPATIETCDATRVILQVGRVTVSGHSCAIVVASAVPKGERADWMIEKLSELGVSRYVPLKTARSVVHPSGAGKLDRWRRIATESARQSRRAGVMQIDELTALEEALQQLHNGLLLSTEPGAMSILDASRQALDRTAAGVSLFIGPEGGWTSDELARCRSAGLTGVRLTETILRIETAAVAAAAVAAVVASNVRERTSAGPEAGQLSSTHQP